MGQEKWWDLMGVSMMGLEPPPTKVLVSYQRQGPPGLAEGLLPVSSLTSWDHPITCDDFMRLLLFWKDHCMKNKKDWSSLKPAYNWTRGEGCRSLPSWDLSFVICKMRVRAIPDPSSSCHFVTSAKNHPTLTLLLLFQRVFGDKTPDILFGWSSQRGCYELILFLFCLLLSLKTKAIVVSGFEFQN